MVSKSLSEWLSAAAKIVDEEKKKHPDEQSAIFFTLDYEGPDSWGALFGFFDRAVGYDAKTPEEAIRMAIESIDKER